VLLIAVLHRCGRRSGRLVHRRGRASQRVRRGDRRRAGARAQMIAALTPEEASSRWSSTSPGWC
jgi:hypothetical protein